MPRGVGIRVLDPRDPADHVRAGSHRLLAQLGRTGVSDHTVLRERHDPDVEHVLELLAGVDNRLKPLEPSCCVDVGEREDVERPEANRVLQRTTHVREDP